MEVATGHDTPSVLFLTSNIEDYLSDSLFHRLRTILGNSVLDFPKKDTSYRSYPHLQSLYGHGFTLYGLLDDLPLDRTLAMERGRRGDFDLIVFGDIWRNFAPLLELLPWLDHSRVAFLDGADHSAPYPCSPALWRVPQWWTLPRAHTRGTYFKRELTVRTTQYRYGPIAFSIPEEKIVEEPLEKLKPFTTHVVDAEVAGRVGAKSEYAFDAEDDYYADLRASRFGITTRRAGWDCLRHYEVAASGCVICFRDLDRKPPTCAPHGLEPGRNCLTYGDANELLRKIDAMTDDEYKTVQAEALEWARANSTRRRAEEFLASLGFGRQG
jgi:hypothetical protein